MDHWLMGGSLAHRWRDVRLGEPGVRRRRDVSQRGEGLSQRGFYPRREDGSAGPGQAPQAMGRKEHPVLVENL